ncbi:phospholipase [Nocardia sp. SYP-A9097]|uniref:phospholipase D family protein n=1 Tax=Nocardia sp. SYP-A9097 TaxID=2663237 RepID=UPI0013227CDE|nr:phospholipase D family protein [Nocardia sp. SYP-A9097]MRH93400.1 phospholipase [Nocardia sp. SYP-A9097]
MGITDWLISAEERGNRATGLDRRHTDGAAWTAGNEVRLLVHGASYFGELLRCVRLMRAGDLLLFTDWRGDPDQAMNADGDEISVLLCEAAIRGVVVKGLIWRSHVDAFAFSEQQNRHLGEDIGAAGGECLRDMRVRVGGSHHQKFVVLRHPGRPELDIAFVGGIDLCHSRRDDSDHRGDSQSQPIAAVYGSRPPWHDIQLAIQGPAVGDVETVFRERWEDPAPLSRNPFERIIDALRREDVTPGVLPVQLPDPLPRGSHTVQVLRTYPRRVGYPFAPNGERSIARAYEKVLARAHTLIYVEDQYFWSAEVAACFAAALRASPTLHLIAVLPHHPDQDGRLSQPPNLVGQQGALDLLRAAGGDRVAVYGIENLAGTPVYVHAKVCVIDDVWASVGSDNLNRRSWTYDSELSCAIVDEAVDQRIPLSPSRFGEPAGVFARDLRLTLAREHLDRGVGDDADLVDPRTAFTVFGASAATLARWYADGQRGPRPPGRLRPHDPPRLSRATRAWATPLYRTFYDPDGRPPRLRRRHRF